MIALKTILLSKKCLIVVLLLANLYPPNKIPKPTIAATILNRKP